MDDCANAQYPPITGELRKAFMASGGIVKLDGGIVEEYMTIAKSELDDLCDAIDSVHAELERENSRLRKKVKHQGAQLTEVQDALERRNEGELKPRWQKELNRLKAERDSMAAALDAAQGEHDFAPESHYMLLPKDADGVPIHVGDVMEWPTTGETFRVVGIGDVVLFYVEDGEERAEWTGASTKRHHHTPDTWERIIEDAMTGYTDGEFDKLVARCKALAGDGTGGRNEHY